MLPLNISGHVDNMGFLFILKNDLKKIALAHSMIVESKNNNFKIEP